MTNTMVEHTKVAKAHSKFHSYKTTIPKSIVREWGLDDTSELEWEWTVISNKMVMTIKPVYKK